MLTEYEQMIYDEIVEYFVDIAIEFGKLGLESPYQFSSKEEMYKIYWKEYLNQ